MTVRNPAPTSFSSGRSETHCRLNFTARYSSIPSHPLRYINYCALASEDLS